MDHGGNALTAPIAQSERIDELDALRGFALFGVLLVNFVGFAGGGLMATDAQLGALPTAQQIKPMGQTKPINQVNPMSQIKPMGQMKPMDQIKPMSQIKPMNQMHLS